MEEEEETFQTIQEEIRDAIWALTAKQAEVYEKMKEMDLIIGKLQYLGKQLD